MAVKASTKRVVFIDPDAAVVLKPKKNQQIKVWASDSLKKRITELAWQKRKSVSAIIRDELHSLIRMSPEKIAKLKQPLAHDLTKPIVASIDRKLWAEAMEKARATNITIPEYVRGHLEETFKRYDI